MREAECLIERHAGHRDLGPADLNLASVRGVAEQLRGIVIAVMDPMFAFVIRRESLAVELTNSISCIGGKDDPARTLRIAINRQFKKFRALVIALKPALELPVPEVCRVVEGHAGRVFMMIVHRQDPVLAGLVPDDLRIAAGMFNHRVAFVFGEGSPAIITVGNTFSSPGAGPGGDDHLLGARLPTRRVVLVQNPAAGERPVAAFLVVDGNWQLLPMNQVLTDRMSPMHITPVPAIGIVLEVEVPFAVIINHSVTVIVPPDLLREVELRPQRLAVEIAGPGYLVRLNEHPHTFPGYSINFEYRNLTFEGGNIEKRPETDLVP
ncbi:hypothetical protein ES703_103571 [subsurface metagenome]